MSTPGTCRLGPIEVRRQDGVVVVAPRGEVMTEPGVRRVQDAVRVVLRNRDVRWIVLDLAALDNCSDHFIAGLARLVGDLRRREGGLALCHLSEQVLFLLRLLHFDRVVIVAEEVDDAVAGLLAAGPLATLSQA